MAFDTLRTFILLFVIAILFLSPDSRTPSLSEQSELENHVSGERLALDVLNTSSDGDLDAKNNRWLNLTGFRKDDGYAWNLLPIVQNRAREHLRTILEASPAALKPSNDSTTLDNGEGTEQDVLQTALSSMTVFRDPLPIYQNVTGVVRGEWTRSKIEDHLPQVLNLTHIAPYVDFASSKWDRNITGLSGLLRIRLDEKNSDELLSEPNMIRDIKAQVEIKDETSNGDGWDITMYGVHYIQQGSIILSTTSEKFAGIFALPHFSLSLRAYQLTQALLNRTLLATINERDSSLEPVFDAWTSSPHNPSNAMFPIPHCELVVYLQQFPSDDPSIPFKDLEQELRYPTGAPLPSAPPLKMSALIFSPDCGFVLESIGPPDYTPQEGTHLSGKKLESHISAARHCILVFALLICAELFLLKKQMNDTSTPSTRSRVSFYTISMMALGDGFACMGLMVIPMFIDALFLPSVSTAFLSFLGLSFFGMKFLMDIWAVQAPEREEREREQQRARDRRNAEEAAAQGPTIPSTQSNPTAPDSISASADTLPLPATARRRDNTTATPVILPPDQDLDAAEAADNALQVTQPNNNPPVNALGSGRREMGALYTKFYFLLLSILFLSLHATSWPTTARAIYTNTLTPFYLSFWVPQIYRNVMRNCHKALRWDFVIGESLLRLAPVIYFYAWKDNILLVSTSREALYAIMAWVWVQVWILASQDVLGPRFFVPEGWAPVAYDYHPVLREGDSERGGTIPIGFTETLTAPSSPVAMTSSAATLTGPTSSTMAIPSVGRTGEDGGTQEEKELKKDKEKNKNKRTFTCAICTENLVVPIIPSSSSAQSSNSSSRGDDSKEGNSISTGTTIFSRRAYMVTPCRHIFHTPCLEGWMRYRLQCPICREGLPPL